MRTGLATVSRVVSWSRRVSPDLERNLKQTRGDVFCDWIAAAPSRGRLTSHRLGILSWRARLTEKRCIAPFAIHFVCIAPSSPITLSLMNPKVTHLHPIEAVYVRPFVGVVWGSCSRMWWLRLQLSILHSLQNWQSLEERRVSKQQKQSRCQTQSVTRSPKGHSLNPWQCSSQ